MRIRSLGSILAVAFVLGGVARAGEVGPPSDITVKDFAPGSYVSGIDRAPASFTGSVVYVFLFNVNHASFNSIPALAKLQTEFQSLGLMVIGVHTVQMDKATVAAACREKGANFTIVSGCSVKGHPTDAGFVYIFDHSGACVFAGAQEKSLDALKATLQRAPTAALGDRILVKLKGIYDKVSKGMPVPQALKSAQVLVKSSDKETAEEAAYVVESIVTWAKQRIEDTKNSKDNPMKVLDALNRFAREYDHLEIQKTALEAIKELKADPEFQAEQKAWTMYEQVRDWDKKIKPLRSAKFGTDITSDKFKKNNMILLNSISRTVRRMQLENPESPATSEAEAIAKKYGLLEKDAK